MILINLLNQRGAGPSMISNLLINELLKSPKKNKITLVINDNLDQSNIVTEHDIKVIIIRTFNNKCLDLFYRLLVETIFLPLYCLKTSVKKIIQFGNFCLVPYLCKTVILIHHPYIHDDKLLKNSSTFTRLKENLIRLIFRINLYFRPNTSFFCQTEFMKQSLVKKYKKIHKFINVIPNPLSNAFLKNMSLNYKLIEQNRLSSISECVNLIYVSRYYPHKNHELLFRLYDLLEKDNINFKLYITVSKKNLPIKMFQDFSSLEKIILIGELPQSEIKQYMISSHFHIFPSLSETFGNSINESIYLNLPVLTLKKDFAKVLLKESYFPLLDNLDKASSELYLCQTIPGYYLNYLTGFNKTKKYFLSPSQWLEKILSL